MQLMVGKPRSAGPKSIFVPRGGLRALRWAMALAVLAAMILPVSVARAEEAVHMVTPGEGLATIAEKYNISMDELGAYNGISDPNMIFIGQRLAIPRSFAIANVKPATPDQLPADDGYHVVARGDSLSQIAKNNGMTLADLMRLNGLSNSDFIWVGQTLRVTARVAAVAYDKDKAETPKPADTIYVVRDGDTLSQIAQAHSTTVEQLLVANGLPSENFVWSGQRLRVPEATNRPASMGVAGAPQDGRRWIEIDLSDQTLVAWQGDVPVLRTFVSTGKWETPTVVGNFNIQTKLESQRMYGDDYDLPGVPWVMYFFSDYAIHGAYWHMNFGTPMSHGCVNMTISDAEMLYAWADVGTEVVVNY